LVGERGWREPLHSIVVGVWLKDNRSRATPNMEYLLQMSNHTSPKNWSDPMASNSHNSLPSLKQGTNTTNLTIVTMLPCGRLQPRAPGRHRVPSQAACPAPFFLPRPTHPDHRDLPLSSSLRARSSSSLSSLPHFFQHVV
jgi:hypothetical protein